MGKGNIIACPDCGSRMKIGVLDNDKLVVLSSKQKKQTSEDPKPDEKPSKKRSAVARFLSDVSKSIHEDPDLEDEEEEEEEL